LEDRGETVELPGRDQNDNAMTLSLPDDLFVIGTMNLIDQSIEQIDFALRRRFLWLACPFSKEALLGASEAKWTTLHAKQKWERIEPDFRKLAANVEALNDGIHKSKWLGAQYEIGHTYFIDVAVFLHSFLGPAGGRKQTFLWNKKGDAMEPVQRVWSLSIQPLLEQYLSGLNADDRNAELARLSKVFLKATATE
jgi:5-methylcytosine-specific restriction protein B